MSSASLLHQVSIRIPARLHVAVRLLAKKRRVSINRLAVEGLEETLRKEARGRLRGAYDSLAGVESDVEPYRAAQQEIIRRGR